VLVALNRYQNIEWSVGGASCTQTPAVVTRTTNILSLLWNELQWLVTIRLVQWNLGTVQNLDSGPWILTLDSKMDLVL